MPVVPLPFAADHPSFAGHFPERPIVAGVLLLDWAKTAIESALGVTLHVLTEAKFRSPATPQDVLELDFEADGNIVRFDIRNAERRIANGRFQIAPPPSA
jgi:3-hydroxymyristoyl/3-hydroxydecanoyl-(acyl carrier protein) dehydratase